MKINDFVNIFLWFRTQNHSQTPENLGKQWFSTIFKRRYLRDGWEFGDNQGIWDYLRIELRSIAPSRSLIRSVKRFISDVNHGAIRVLEHATPYQ